MILDERQMAQRHRVAKASGALLDAMATLSRQPDAPSQREWIMALQERQTRLLEWQLQAEWKAQRKAKHQKGKTP